MTAIITAVYDLLLTISPLSKTDDSFMFSGYYLEIRYATLEVATQLSKV